MLEIKVCVGTSCHLKGSYNVLSTLLGSLESSKLHDRAHVQAAFCMGACGQGVCVSLDGERFAVEPERAQEFFEQHVKPRIA